MGKRIIIIAVMLLFLIPFAVSTKQKPTSKTFEAKIHGGITKTKSMSQWEIYKYKDTELMRQPPLCYAPWRAYLAVDQFAEVTTVNNYNALVIKTDLEKAVATDASFNRHFAKRFKGRSIERIYDYCSRTKYVLHVKTAREVFEKREGDCAGMSAAFYVICKANKIPVRYVIGWNKHGCHAWNRVKWKGRWYWLDIAYDKYLSRKLWKGYSIMEKW